jgi:hypothetical protein
MRVEKKAYTEEEMHTWSLRKMFLNLFQKKKCIPVKRSVLPRVLSAKQEYLKMRHIISERKCVIFDAFLSA